MAHVEELLERESGWPDDSVLSDGSVREVLRGMLRYHKREAKPQWWRRFDWLASPPSELATDARTLGGLVRTKTEPYKSAPRKRRLAYEYVLPNQECNLAPGGSIVLRDDDEFIDGGGESSESVESGGEEVQTLSGSLLSLDRSRGLAVVESGTAPPVSVSALPNEFVDASLVARAMRESAAAMAVEPSRRSALGELLARRPPTLSDGGRFSPRMEDPAAAAVAAVLALDRSYLCVQGPPGTGKTYTAAKCIAALVARGSRVGVMAVSHRHKHWGV